MPRPTPDVRRREEALSRERIVHASIELLDRLGEDGLTFRALGDRLATGAGAIYWHIADKNDLLGAACDALVARALEENVATPPEAAIRAVGLGLFDLIDAHPWVGSILTGLPGQRPIVRVLERIGQQVRALAVPERRQRAAVGTLMGYILGVSRQNAANHALARAQRLDRDAFLDALAIAWSQLDPADYPFTRSVAATLRGHDDRADFLAGIDLILAGIRVSPRRRPAGIKR